MKTHDSAVEHDRQNGLNVEDMLRSVRFASLTSLEDRKARERSEKTAVFRQQWNVPKRHETAKAERDGGFGRALEAIERRLGSGVIFGIFGTRGAGKTQLAVEALRSATGRLMSARYITAMDLFMRLKATFRRDSQEAEKDVLSSMRKPRVLVIDEIGKRGESEWENNLFFELINARYNDMTDTLLIANLSEKDFVQAVGPSLASRMNETGGLIHADWPSRR